MSTSAPARRPLEAALTAAFTPRTLAFLRALERNNRREWFHARKDRYEADVRAPMVALVERAGRRLRRLRARFGREPARRRYAGPTATRDSPRTRRRSRRTSRPCSRTASCRSMKAQDSTWR
ncbi:MAG: DUF2461 domain-containing protein [Comamonadaceae bacterium]|nr:DUF2461 domain-containing protein [Comamonadaceae bacterium]